MTDRLLTTKEAAYLLAVSTTWISGAARRGELPAYRVADGWRFDVDEIGLWLTAQGNAAVERPENPKRRILPPPRPARTGPRPEPIVDLEHSVTAEHVAAVLQVPVDAVRRWVVEAILPGVHSGRSWLVDGWAFEQWQAILSKSDHLDTLPPGRTRTASIRERILSNLLRRMGITVTIGSWQQRGGLTPTWAEAVIDPRRHRQAQ